MGLLEARRQLAAKQAFAEQLVTALPAAELAPLFVSETRLEDVIDLAASFAARFLPAEAVEAEPAPPIDSLLLPGVLHCQARIRNEELLSQAEHLLVSVAEQWAGHNPCASELHKRCASIRVLQQQQRRARMNMGKPAPPKPD